MASSANERTDEDAINLVARNCGSLAIECSDVAGYVHGVEGAFDVGEVRKRARLVRVVDQLLICNTGQVYVRPRPGL